MKKYLGVLLLLTACETQPTKVYESAKPLISRAVSHELVISEKTIFIDTRSAFLFNLSHMPGAINLSWEEFTEASGKFRGRLVKDLYHVTRRLSRLGIDTKSSIIVLGDGKSGHGEEGRLAWTLRYLGIKDVNFASKDYFDQTKWIHVKSPEPVIASVPPWKPILETKIIFDREEIQKLKKADVGSGAKTLLIDVRDTSDFLRTLPAVVNPNVKVINIQWREFIDDKGRPDLQVGKKLTDIGTSVTQRILVIGETGVESGLVVEALNALGFSNSAHFLGGLRELESKK